VNAGAHELGSRLYLAKVDVLDGARLQLGGMAAVRIAAPTDRLNVKRPEIVSVIVFGRLSAAIDASAGLLRWQIPVTLRGGHSDHCLYLQLVNQGPASAARGLEGRPSPHRFAADTTRGRLPLSHCRHRSARKRPCPWTSERSQALFRVLAYAFRRSSWKSSPASRRRFPPLSVDSETFSSIRLVPWVK
jgi:hypothetical protein